MLLETGSSLGGLTKKANLRRYKLTQKSWTPNPTKIGQLHGMAILGLAQLPKILSFGVMLKN